jgi:hypothetical protein
MKITIITFGEYLKKADANKERYIYPFQYENIPRDTLGIVNFRSWMPVEFTPDAKQSLQDGAYR